MQRASFYQFACAGLLAFALMCFNACASVPYDVAFGEVDLKVANKQLRVEYAYSIEQSARGLMYRTELCDNCGMLFEFDFPRIASFFMKNTLLPLDIAYIDERGIIVDIKPLYPFVINPVRSSRLVLYALEMNRGWFARNNIKTGDKVSVINRYTVDDLKQEGNVSE